MVARGMDASPPASKTPKHHESPSDGPGGSPGRGVKRQKVTRACDNCKSRKRRCTGELPCTACHSTGSNCTYTASYTRGRLVQPTPAAHLRNDNGSIPPSAPPAVQNALAPIPNGTESRASRAASPEATSTFAGQYLGPTSPYTFLRRAWKRFEQDGARADIVGGAPTDDVGQSESILAFGDRQVPAVILHEFQLPPRKTSFLLLNHYFDLAMPTYRFMHKPTIAQWLEEYHQVEEQGPGRAILLPVRQAVVLMVLATARFFNVGNNSEILDPDEHSWRESERYFQSAQVRLEAESGKPRLESVQARIASCLYLLHTSRPSQAWYKFGTTIQLAMALGLHRATSVPSTQPDPVTRECRKRVFWAASTLDTYLSVVLGRPPLIHLDDVDQKFPEAIDDEDLSTTGAVLEGPPRDSIVKASILHAKITRIVKKAAREQYSVHRKSCSQKLETAEKLNAETAAWHSSLPVVLSGAIHPSSLIAIFRRQITVLQLAHCHAHMLINRPSLLLDTSSQIALKESQVDTCISAAKAALDCTLAAGLGQHGFQAFWYTQFVCFNALSIVWVWVLQRRHNRLPPLKSIKDDELIRLANHVQRYLSEATQANAPSLRYSIVLEELREEAERTSAKPIPRPPHLNAIVDAPANGSPSYDTSTDTLTDRLSDVLVSNATDNLIETMDAFTTDFPLDPDLWLSLDAFPFTEFGQLE